MLHTSRPKGYHYVISGSHLKLAYMEHVHLVKILMTKRSFGYSELIKKISDNEYPVNYHSVARVDFVQDRMFLNVYLCKSVFAVSKA